MENNGNEKKRCSKSIMNKNVTDFRHFLKNPHMNEDGISWAFNLRAYQPHSSKGAEGSQENRDAHPPQVAFKRTECSSSKERQLSEKKYTTFNSVDFEGFLSKKNAKAKIENHDNLMFYATLRGEEPLSSCVKHSSKFNNIPFKDRKEPPFLLAKTNIKKLHEIRKNDKENALDGDHKFPSYSEKILRTRNFGLLNNFASKHGRYRVSLPGLAWQVGLRYY